MENSIFVQAAKFLRERRGGRRRRAAVFCLAVLVICGTAWGLSKKGQALTRAEDVLDCQLVIHEHNGDCYDGDGNLICGMADYVFHEHDESCYDAEEELVCLLPEINEHIHMDDCFETEEILTCTQEETSPEETASSKEEIASEEENEVTENFNSGADTVFNNTGEPELICGRGEHAHESACYKIETEISYNEETTETEVLVCELEEHSHSEECYSTESNIDETETVEEPDYAEEPKYVEEDETAGEGHVHSEDCYKTVRRFTCNEKAVHIHGDSCYDKEGSLVCRAPVVETVETHVHGKECFKFDDDADDAEYTKIFSNDDITVTAVYKKSAGIPEEVELTADLTTQESDLKEYKQRLEGLLGEEETLAMILQLRLCSDDEIIVPADTISLTVEFLNDSIYDEGDTVKVARMREDGAELISAAYTEDGRSITFETEELTELAFIVQEEKDAHMLTYVGGDYIVTVALGEDTLVPEDAELIVEQIMEVSAPETYEACIERLEEAEDILSENEMAAMLLRMKIFAGNNEIVPDEAMDVTVRFLNREIYFEGDAVKVAHFTTDDIELLSASDIDEEVSTTFTVNELAGFAFITGADIRTLISAGEDFIVTVRFGKEAKIPKDVQLVAERITQEINPESFAECKNELRERVEEKFVIMDALMEIGFYVDGKEIEPQDTVDVKIQLLNADDLKLEEDDSHMVVHFVEDGVEILEDADIFEDEGNSLSMTFQTDSFSYFAMVRGANEVMNEEQFREAIENAAEGETVRIGKNLSFPDGTLDYGDHIGAAGNKIVAKLDGSKKVTLDLNGYTIKIADNNMTLVDINDAELTVKDSWCETFKTGESQAERDLYSINYEITTSQAIDEFSGKTMEVSETRTALGGAIVGNGGRDGTDGNRAAVFTMTGGTLNIESGIVAENGNRAVQSIGGTINLNGGFLLNNSAKDLYEKNDGGEYDDDYSLGNYGYAIGGAVICEEGGTINLNGTILSGNKAVEGGAIELTDSNITISGGFVTHNDAYYGQWGRGGGGIQLHGSTLEITGGQITANHTLGGGGGICAVRQSEVHLEGGFIAANSTEDNAFGEGGGVALYEEWIDLDGDGEKEHYVPTAYIGDKYRNSKIYITHNHSNTTIDWGGGGLFISEGAKAYLYNTLITENSAEGFGGGLAGCATGRILDFNEYGAAIYGNSAMGAAYAGEGSTKHADKEHTEDNSAFWERDDNGKYLFQDYFSALYSYVENKMLGGGFENWDGSIDKERIDRSLGTWTSCYVAGLTADPNPEDLATAKELACVYITGNTSKTHGGGIMCNGILIIGDTKGEIEISSALKIEATKKLMDSSGKDIQMEAGQFSFTVYEDEKCTSPVAVGTNDENGEITFNKLFAFDLKNSTSDNGNPVYDGGENTYYYYYYIKEDDRLPDKSNNLGIEIDSTVYRLSVAVKKEWKEKLGSIDKYVDEIKHIKVEKKNESGEWDRVSVGTNESFSVDYVPENNHWNLIETHPITVLLTTNPWNENESIPTFTNTKKNVTQITVKKEWSDNSVPEGASVTVQLYQKVSDSDGLRKLYSEKVLNDSNEWSYEWESLPTTTEDGLSCDYEVEEVAVNGVENLVNNYVIEYAYVLDKSGASIVTITNTPKTYKLELTKKDENGGLLPRAQFEIFREGEEKTLEFRQVFGAYVLDDGCGGRVTSKLFTDEDGKLIVSGLPAGVYILRETVAPAGYKTAVDHIITLSTESEVVCKEKQGEDHKFYFDKDMYILQFILLDRKEKFELPETGGFGTIYINIFGIIVMFVGVALAYITYRRRRER